MSKYNTAMGREIDMSSLAAKNEKVRAVGNMNVNARGDVLNSQNNVITDNNARINSIYNKTVSDAMDISKPPTIQPDEE
jgi:hypothetical protein